MLKHNSWFLSFKQKEAACIRLFCFHYGGGSASVFRKWSEDLISDSELIAIQLPGREERFNEPLLNNVFEVVDNLCQNFSDYLDKPFVLFGHSIGALIAFEFTRALRKRGMRQPEHLIISGTKAPQVPIKRQLIHNLPDAEFIEELKKYNGIPEDIINDEEIMSVFAPAIRTDFCISETYTYSKEKPLILPITALGSLNDNTFDFADLLKWEEQTIRDFKYHVLAGDHFFIKTSYKKLIGIVNQVLYNEMIKFI